MKRLILTLTFAVGAVTAFACTNFIVTKGASTDGSVMVTYAADSHQLYGALYYTPKGNFKPGTMLRVDEWDTGKACRSHYGCSRLGFRQIPRRYRSGACNLCYCG